MKLKFFIVICAALSFSTVVRAQSSDDLLRITSTNDAVSARAASLGTSFMGIADDASAAMLNPAGLSLLHHSEIDFGFGMYRASTDAAYLGNTSSTSAHEIMPSYAAYASPFRFGGGRGGISLLVNYDESLRAGYSLDGFNAKSSIVPSMLGDVGSSLTDNLLYQTYVADTVKGRLVSPIVDSMQQHATINQTGGRGSFLFGIGFELTPNLSLGVSVGSRWTDYSYSRSFLESDINNKYNKYDTVVPRSNLDLNRLQVDDRLHQTSSAFDLRLSLMGTLGDWGRLSISMSPPLSHHVHEDYSRAAAAYYDPKPDSAYTYSYNYTNDYNLSSPWDLGMAASVHVEGLSLAAAVRYRDYSSTSFDVPSDYYQFYTTLNDSIRTQLQEQLEWSVGAEYKIPVLPLYVRASYDRTGSAYVQRIADASTTVTAVGLGIVADKRVRIDLTGRFSKMSGNYAAYGDGSNASYALTMKPSQFILQFSYRY